MKRNMLEENKNKGFSLVELIVVVAIMCVLVGMTSFGVTMLSGKNAQKACSKMTSNVERTRTVSMGKNTVSLKLYVKSSGIFSQETVDGVAGDEIVLSSNDVKCSYMIGDSKVDLVAGNTLTFAFDRSDGSLKSIVDENSNYIYQAGVTKNIDLISFCFTKNSKEYMFSIVPVTGRVN